MIKKRFISMLVLLAAVVTGTVAQTIDLATVTEATTVEDGYTLTGTLGANVKISIAEGATVTLDGVTINGVDDGSYAWAGITCLGDATIILSGTNTVKGFYSEFPGIYVPVDKTLTIEGSGSLTASSNFFGCGIGGGYYKSCGNIVIAGGTITATGGMNAAGIGGGNNSSCGNISISGGTVTANGGNQAAGIGGGSEGSCGTISITGGTITATGSFYAAGIGSGYGGPCGTVTITNGVTSVTATKGEDANYSIGAGMDGSCGTVTIGCTLDGGGNPVGGTTGQITTSPYTYEGNPTAPSTYTVTLKEGTEDATSWTIAPAEATTTGVAAGTTVTATYNGMKKVKSVKAKKKASAGPVTYTELNGGEVLHVGDIINLSEEISFNSGDYYMGSYGSPYTVVRADLTIDEYEETVVNEKADGNYYVIKANDGGYYHFERALGVTDKSDGILVTYNGKSGKWSDYTFTVHEP